MIILNKTQSLDYSEDINKLIAWLSQDPTPKLTKGDLTVEFEKKWSEWFIIKK